MTITLYDASVPVFRRTLAALAAVLEKAAAHASERRIDPAVLLAARLFPDMFPLTRQVQIATDHAKGAVARLTGSENPSFPDIEKSFEELTGRIGSILEFVGSVPPESFAGAEQRQVTVRVAGGERTMPGTAYLFHVALPNFFFHASTAYGILRHNGVALGKGDFLGRGPF